MLITRHLTDRMSGMCKTGCFNAEAAQEAQKSFGPRCLRPTEGRKSPWGRRRKWALARYMLLPITNVNITNAGIY